MRKNEDPRLSFSTPEFKEAQRVFTDGFKVQHYLLLHLMTLVSQLEYFTACWVKRVHQYHWDVCAEKLWEASGMGLGERLSSFDTAAAEA